MNREVSARDFSSIVLRPAGVVVCKRFSFVRVVGGFQKSPAGRYNLVIAGGGSSESFAASVAIVEVLC